MSPRPRSTPTSRTSSTAGVEAPYPGEDRRLIPSPEGRDLRPGAGDERRRASPMRWSRRSDPIAYDFIVANFANPDMVGHTGVWEATLTALEVVDGCLGRIVAALAAVTRDPAAQAPPRHHRRPRQRRRPARRGRPAGDRPFAQSGAVRAGRAGRGTGCAWTTASSPTSRRRSSSWPACRAGTG